MGLGVSSQENEFIVSGAVHNHTFKYSNSNWSNISFADGGDCEVNWIDNTYYGLANQYHWVNNTTFYTQPEWIIGLEYEFNPQNMDIVYFGSGRKTVGSIEIAHLVRHDHVINDEAEIAVPEEIGAVGPIGVVNDSIIFCADFGWTNATTPNRMIETTDGGDNWIDHSFDSVFYKDNGSWSYYGSLVYLLRWKTISDILINPRNKNEIWISITGVWKEGWPSTVTGGKFRVLRTTDGGNTWYDYSESLPAFPALCLEYQPGTNDRIFVGTDVGVFYRDADMEQWECFSENLPVCFVTDLDYEPCNNSLYASTYGRGIYKSAILFDDQQESDTIPFGQNIVWDQSRIIFSNVFIPDSTTLTINADMYVMEGNKFIVMPGGNLFIEDCEIRNRCDGIWGGIEVWGNPDTTQMYSGLQGKIELENVIITNANIGILAGRVGEDGWSYISGYEGGIIKAENTTFFNNNLSVAFLPYQNFHPVTGNEVYNYSGFKKCKFEISMNQSSDVDFDEFVYLAGVHGIKFKGCRFSNQRSFQSYSSAERGIGIYSVSSTFYITEDCYDPTISPCDSVIPCKFDSLTYGIKAFGINPTNTCNIELSEFWHNRTGIYLSSMDQSAVNQNYFELFGESDTTYNKLDCGLYLENSTGYQVEENEFKSFYQIGSPVTSVGIAIHNSGSNNNEIYNNYCHNLFVGILAQNENRGNKGLTGLQILCNDFATCEYDIAVTSDSVHSDYGIRGGQGSSANLITAPANNIFSYTHNNDESDYFNGGENFTYWHLQDTISANVKPKKYTPLPKINLQANTYITSSFVKEDNCPSSFSSGGGIEENRSAMNEADIKIDSTQNLLSILTDGGDTEALNTEVETSFPNQAVDVRNQLIGDSPYLSDSVMVSAVEQENVLTEAMVTEILIANPQSAKSDTVQNALDNRFNQLTEDQRTDVDQGWFIIGAKEALESNLAHYQYNRHKAFNNIIRIFRNDSLCTAPSDSIISLLEEESNLHAQYNIVFEYIAKGDDTSAANILNGIPNLFDLTSIQIAQHQQYISFTTLLTQLKIQNKTLFNADSTQKNDLISIYNNSNGKLHAIARNILINIDTLIYDEPYILPDESLKEETIKKVPIRKDYKEDRFKLYPNPAGNYVIIEYILKGENPVGTVNILDNRGIVMKMITLNKTHDYLLVPTSDLPSGVYYFNFVVDAEFVQTISLVVSH